QRRRSRSPIPRRDRTGRVARGARPRRPAAARTRATRGDRQSGVRLLHFRPLGRRVRARARSRAAADLAGHGQLDLPRRLAATARLLRWLAAERSLARADRRLRSMERRALARLLTP